MKIRRRRRARSQDGQCMRIEETKGTLPQAGLPPASPLKEFDDPAQGKAIIGPAQLKRMEIFADGQNAVLFDPKSAGGMLGADGRRTSGRALRRQVGRHARNAIGEKPLSSRGNALRAIELFKRIPRHA
jgi:hypothetical protein